MTALSLSVSYIWKDSLYIETRSSIRQDKTRLHRWHGAVCYLENTTGPQLSIKMSSYQYRKSHRGDKTILRPSYPHNGIFFTGKMTFLYWIRAQDPVCKWRPSFEI